MLQIVPFTSSNYPITQFLNRQFPNYPIGNSPISQFPNRNCQIAQLPFPIADLFAVTNFRLPISDFLHGSSQPPDALADRLG